MAPISIRSMEMPRNWSATPLSRTVRSRRSLASRFPTIAHKVWRDSDAAQTERDPVQKQDMAWLGGTLLQRTRSSYIRDANRVASRKVADLFLRDEPVNWWKPMFDATSP